jgi:hypothetical protein
VDEWARGERDALRGAWRDGVIQLARAAESRADAEDAAVRLIACLEEDPLAEDALQALLRIALRAHRREAALELFERLRARQQAELGLAPIRETVELAAQVRRAERLAEPAPSAADHRDNSVPTALRRPVHLVGREDEIAQLADGRPTTVLVAGEPGVGKTALLEHALPRARWIVCREGLSDVPFQAIAEYVEDQRESLHYSPVQRRALASLVPELAGDEVLPIEEPAQARAHLLDAVLQLLGAAGAVVFDDVQWADAGTREVVLRLALQARVPVRVAYRSNEASPALSEWLERLRVVPDTQEIVLAPLSSRAVANLIARLGGAADGAPLFSARLHAHTGGNPFFVLESLRALFESGRLRAEPSGWVSQLDAITNDYAELHMPARVADIVRRRVDRLSETARRALTLVAVAGELDAGVRGADEIGATKRLSCRSKGPVGGSRRRGSRVRREHCFASAHRARRRTLRSRGSRTRGAAGDPAAPAAGSDDDRRIDQPGRGL